MAVEAEQMNNMETYHREPVWMLAEPVENVHEAQNLIDGADIVVGEQQYNNEDQMEQEQYAVGRQNELLHAADYKVCLIINNSGCKKRQSITSA